MKIYLDADFKCHASNSSDLREVEADFFNGKCAAFIEGYRFVPGGESWQREDGEVFTGEMVAPLVDYAELDAAQRTYEQEVIKDMKEALNALGVSVDG